MIAIVFSCNRSDTVPIISASGDSGSQPTAPCLGFTEQALDSVGVFHNEFVIDALSGIDLENCTNCLEDIIVEFEDLATIFDLDQDQIDYMVGVGTSTVDSLDYYNYDLRNWTSHPFSDSVYMYLLIIQDSIDSAEDYEELTNALAIIQMQADDELNCSDWEQVTTAIKVAENSAYLWMSVELGGIGTGDLTEWRNVVLADAVGATTYMIGLGVGMAFLAVVPGANLAILGMWALSTALASAGALISV